MQQVQGYSSDAAATIAISTTTSGAVNIRGYQRGGFVLPAAFTGSAVTFLVSVDGVTYIVLNDTSNSAVSQTVTAAKSYALPAAIFSFNFFKFVSGSSEAAARSIAVSLKY